MTTDRITKKTTPSTAILSGVAPHSTTNELAKDVPLEKTTSTGSSALPGAFPETPANELSVNPLPATAGGTNPVDLAPGEKVPHSSNFTDNTITSGVHDDPELVEKLRAQEQKKEGEQTFGVAPLPAFPGGVNPVTLAPGEKVPHPSNFTNDTLTSTSHDDPELVAKLAKAQAQDKKEGEQTFGVSPLPAFPGAVNPVQVAPGEKILGHETLTGDTIHSNVRTDPESYEKSSVVGSAAPVLPPVVTPQVEREQKGAGLFGLPPVSNSLIPESSLPMGTSGHESADAGPFTQSAGPHTTTAALAGNVPLESSKVPEIVKESQQAAGVDPEASAIAEEVREKSAVEKELESKVATVPSTSEGVAGQGTTKSEKQVTAGEAAAAVSAAALAVGGAAYAATSGLASKLPASVTSKLPVGVQESINNINTDSDSKIAAARNTPAVVQDSIAESGKGPEAAASEEAVIEKKQVEKELLSEVKKVNSSGEPAPKITADSSSKTAGLTSTGAVSSTTASNVPEAVKESIAQSGQGPEAAANKEVVAEKQQLEKELLKEVKPETATGEAAPKPVAKDSQYTDKAPSTPIKNLTAPVIASEPGSRDVSPGTMPGSRVQTRQDEPVVTSGVASTTTAEKSTPTKSATATPTKPAASTSKTTESPASASASQKKKNRASAFFSKIKSKLSDK